MNSMKQESRRAGPTSTPSQVEVVRASTSIASSDARSKTHPTTATTAPNATLINKRRAPNLIDEENIHISVNLSVNTNFSSSASLSPSQKVPQLEQHFSSDDSDNDRVNEEMNQIFERQMYTFGGRKRETPEASKISSQLRRTPGANSMHRSAFQQHNSHNFQGQDQGPGQNQTETQTQGQLQTRSQQTNTPVLRRTPGASAMHRSRAFQDPSKQSLVIQTEDTVKQHKHQRGGNNSTHDAANAMEFGLTFSSPAARRSQTSRSGQNTVQKVTPNINSRTPRYHQTPAKGIVTDSATDSGTATMKSNSKLKPPLPTPLQKNIKVRDAYLYTPAGVSLAKNKNLNLRTPGNGAFSPNTCQLAATIDDLLDEDEENEIFSINGISSVVSSSKREPSLPPIQKASSFGAESYISAVSSTLSYEDLFENLTLDTSKEYKNRNLVLVENRSNSDVTSSTGTFEVPLRPKFVHNSFRLDSSYNSDVSSVNNSSSNDVESRNNNNKSMNSIKRQVNFNKLPIGSGAFSPHRQKSNSRDSKESLLRVPTPKKVCQPSRGPARPSQHAMKDEQIGILETEHQVQSNLQQQQQHHYHHQNTIPPQYVETNQGSYDVGCNMGYNGNLELYQYQPHPINQPINQPIQYPQQIPMMNNHHMEYLNHLQHLHPHHTISPVTVPHQMSPLTLPTYPASMHYECPSPVQFTTQTPNLGWSEQGNQWGNMGDGGWEHHSQSQDFAFNGAQYFSRDMNHQHAPSPPPPQLLPPYAVPNQFITGAGYHRNNDPMYHGHEAGSNINGVRNHEHYQHALRQGSRNKKRTDKFQGEINTKENKKVLLNSQRQERFDGMAENGKRKTRNKQVKKLTKSMKERSEEIYGKTKKSTMSKKKVISDSNMRRKDKDNYPQPRTGNGLYSSSKESKKIKESDSKKEFLTPEEKVAQAKRSELIETPAIRAIFKDFYRQYRLKEKISLDAAANFASDCLHDEGFPTSVHWRIYLELADIAKRANKFNEAQELFNQVCTIQPYASQGWLEYSKLEEECGRLSECSQILKRGLEFCPNNEHLLIRAIKHEERLAHEQGNSDLSRARELLAPLKHCGIEKVWRVVLEGALMEARAGYEVEARRILKYLMHWIPWYGPLYLEAFRLERDSDRPIDALDIVERGLKEIPRYGPLWFGAFRLCEGLDVENNDLHLPRTLGMINRATECISRELLWKVHLEAAQSQERGAHLEARDNKLVSLSERLSESRKRFIMTIGACPTNLRWKVWLAAGRMELSAGRFDEARKIFQKSYSVVPVKGRPAVLLECARLEEFVGDTLLAKAILCKSRSEEGSDWKVWLQSVSVEIRNGNRCEAIKLALGGLKLHSGTGRLWAAFVQLRENDCKKAQMMALNQALQAVPKSGEVWCEAARIFLNPFSVQFNLETSERHLEFATKFTPQYGDSFIETLRLQLLSRFLLPLCQHFLDDMKSRLTKCLEEEEVCKKSSDQCHSTFIKTLCICLRETVQNMKSVDFILNNDRDLDHTLDAVETSKLELHCSNADPNYGKLWFNCRCRPSDTARTVMKKAKHIIGHNLGCYGYLYVAATMRQIAIDMLTTHEMNLRRSSCNNNQNMEDLEKREREKWIDTVPSLESILLCEEGYMTDDVNYCVDDNKNESEHDMLLLERGISSSNFTTGIYELNETINLMDLSLMERRKILFGSDLLL